MRKCLNPECLQLNPDNHNFCYKCGSKLLLQKCYSAQDIIGEGSFGRTFLAVDESKPSKPFCVIKQFLPQSEHNAKAVELFEREAQQLQKLGEHPQIPELFSYFEEEKRLYIVQEFIDGQDLDKELEQQGIFTEQQIQKLLKSLLEVLKFVHDKKVIHRDIKPENIMRRSIDRKLVLIDFGAAKSIQVNQSTVKGTAIRTIQYCAPEQLRGDVKYNSDLYGLGATCLHLLTGQNILDWDISNDKWSWKNFLYNRNVSQELVNILDRLLEDDYRSRYQSAEEVLADLEPKTIPDLTPVPEYLRDCNWLRRKLETTNIDAVVLEFSRYNNKDSFLVNLEIALQNSYNILKYDKSQLASQLWGRLLDPDTIKKYSCNHIENFLKQVYIQSQQPWFRPWCGYFNIQNNLSITTIGMRYDKVHDLDIMPNGKQVLCGSDNGLTLWDLDKKQKIIDFQGILWKVRLMKPVRAVKTVVLTLNGKRAISCSSSGVQLWNTNTGEELAFLNSGVTAMAISPNGRQALFGYNYNTLKFWDIDTSQEMWSVQGFYSSYSRNKINTVAITPDGKKALSGSDYQLKLWDLETGLELYTFIERDAQISTIVISPDGKKALSKSGHGVLRLWDLEKRQEVKTLFSPANGDYALIITEDSQHTIIGTQNGIKLWNLETGYEVCTLSYRYSANSLAITSDGKYLISGSEKNNFRKEDIEDKFTVKVWNLQDINSLRSKKNHNDVVTAVAITPNGQQVLSSSADKTLKLWDIKTGQIIHTFNGHTERVNSIAITPDGKKALSGSVDKTLKLWDLTTGQIIHSFEGHSTPVQCVAIRPNSNGKQALSNSDDRTMKLWNLATGKILRTFKGHPGGDKVLVFTPNGKEVIYNLPNNNLALWNIHKYLGLYRFLSTEKYEYNSFSNYVNDESVNVVAVSQDSQFMISSSSGKLVLWNLQTRQLMRGLGCHQGLITTIAITPDSQKAVSGGLDSQLKLWNLKTRDILATATLTMDSPILCCDIAPDGRTIVAGDMSGRVMFFSLEGI